MPRGRFTDHLGAACYVAWGLLHYQAARGVAELGAILPPGMTQGRVYQDAWHLAFFATVAVVVAVRLNWWGDRLGYWINLVAISVTDIGFILFVLVPGYVPIFPGILGPMFWVLGAALTTVSYPRPPRDQH